MGSDPPRVALFSLLWLAPTHPPPMAAAVAILPMKRPIGDFEWRTDMTEVVLDVKLASLGVLNISPRELTDFGGETKGCINSAGNRAEEEIHQTPPHPTKSD